MVIFLLVIEMSKKDYVSLEQVPYIYYPLYFQKNTISMRALIDLGTEINTIILVYILKLYLKFYYTNIRAQKRDNSTFKMFEIVLASF